MLDHCSRMVNHDCTCGWAARGIVVPRTIVLFASEYAIHFPAHHQPKAVSMVASPGLNLEHQAANYLAFVSHQSEFSC